MKHIKSFFTALGREFARAFKDTLKWWLIPITVKCWFLVALMLLIDVSHVWDTQTRGVPFNGLAFIVTLVLGVAFAFAARGAWRLRRRWKQEEPTK